MEEKKTFIRVFVENIVYLQQIVYIKQLNYGTIKKRETYS